MRTSDDSCQRWTGQGQPSASHPVLTYQICSLVIKP
jgi:hypothetical protein